MAIILHLKNKSLTLDVQKHINTCLSLFGGTGYAMACIGIRDKPHIW